MTDFSLLIERVLARKVAFLVTFFIIFTVSYGVLFVLDFLPEAPENTPISNDSKTTEGKLEIYDTNATNTVSISEPKVEVIDITSVNRIDPAKISSSSSSPTNTSVAADDTLPVMLKIPSLDRVVTILNPSSRTIANLDAALLKGVVRHPDSAVLGQEGNLFILGHSSYLPKVINKNFQALNGIQNLKWGDTVTLQSKDTVYTYQVKKVYQAKAENITVPIAGTGKHLTLATCNSFGSKADRYIVEADLLSTTTI